MKYPLTCTTVRRNRSLSHHVLTLLTEEDRRMWRRISHVFHVLLYFGFPTITALIGIYLTYRATQLDGSMADRAYLIGTAMLIGSWAWTASRSARHRAEAEARLETTIEDLTERVDDLEAYRDKVQRAIDTKTATAVVLEAVEYPSEDVPPWVHRNHHEKPAPVIPMEPPHTGT